MDTSAASTPVHNLHALLEADDVDVFRAMLQGDATILEEMDLDAPAPDAGATRRITRETIADPQIGLDVAMGAAIARAPGILELLLAQRLTGRFIDAFPPDFIANPNDDRARRTLGVMLTHGYDPNIAEGLLLARSSINGDRATAEALFAAGGTPASIPEMDPNDADCEDEIAWHDSDPGRQLRAWHREWLATHLTRALADQGPDADHAPDAPTSEAGPGLGV